MSLTYSKVQNSPPECTRTRPDDAQQIPINHLWYLTLNLRAHVLKSRKSKATRFPSGIRAFSAREALERSLCFIQRILSGEVLRADSETSRGEKSWNNKEFYEFQIFGEFVRNAAPDSFCTPKITLFLYFAEIDKRPHTCKNALRLVQERQDRTRRRTKWAQ